MSSSISVQMRAHLALATATLAQAWRISARDGTIIRVISHTRNLLIDGELYNAIPIGPVPTEQKSGLSPDNTEVTAILASNYFTEQDFLSGKWDFARVEMMVINYLDPGMGPAQRLVGYFGEITTRNGVFSAEVRSLAQLLAQDMGETTAPHCVVRVLGDSRCKVNLAAFTFATTIASVIDRRTVTIGTTQADGFFDYGTLTFTSGANLGFAMEVKHSVGNRLELVLPFSREIVVGDSIVAVAGCDRTRATCRDKFANIENFRGFPDSPGNRKLLHIP